MAGLLRPLSLPPGITESYLPTSDLTYHLLEAGNEPGNKKPLLLLLHGFPEVAYSWRKVMPSLAAAGFHVVAYDQRGYGRTTGWDTRPFAEVDLHTFSFTRLVADAVRLVAALGYNEVHCVIGHDFGAAAASICALTRGDLFKRVICMSHPFSGAPSFPFNTRSIPKQADTGPDVHQALAELPTPRKHYKWYYSTEPACQEMTEPQEGLHQFLRGYFHLKSADWAGNKPEPLKSWSAEQLAKLPYYYVMPLRSSMRGAVAHDMASEDSSAVLRSSQRWLSDDELQVYVDEFARNTFQGGLNWYRVSTNPENMKDVGLFSGKKIDVPALFIAGKQDWGTYQQPGAFENMANVCSQFKGAKLIDGAGHWVQQEQPEQVIKLTLEFLGVKSSL